MEGWINIKRGWFWSSRYGYISSGELKYFDNQAMTKLKRSFLLKDYQIVQNRGDKTIKLVQNNSEKLQIKSELHELWYSKLIQAKVAAMNISYIPQQQAQDMIRRNSQDANQQILFPQNNNPNSEVNPLDITNFTITHNQQIQNRPQNILNLQPPQFRNFYDAPQNQRKFYETTFNNQQRLSEEQQLQSLQLQQQQQQQQLSQQNQQRIINNPQNIHSLQTSKLPIQSQQKQKANDIQKQNAEPEKKGILSKITDFLRGNDYYFQENEEKYCGKQEDYYDDSFVSELNNNESDKKEAKQKIEELLFPITSQPNLFNYQQNSINIQFNHMQQQQLQQLFEQKNNVFLIRIFISLILMSIIIFNWIQWQSNQLIYTFCSVIIILFHVLYRYSLSTKTASKCRIDAFIQKPIEINNYYTVNQLLTQLKQINKNIIVFEQQKNKELYIYDRNQWFSAIYIISIIKSSKMEIKIFSKNYEYIDSIIDNFTTNYSLKKGIWQDIQKYHPRKILLSDLFANQWKSQLMNYEKYKQNLKDPLNKTVFIIFWVIKNNWQLSYEFFTLVLVLLRIRDQIENHFEWMLVSHWFLIFIYGITFTKLSYFVENLFLELRKDMRILQRQADRLNNYHYMNDTYNITFTKQEMAIYEKINDIEVWVVCSSLFASIIFRDWIKVISVILLPTLKVSFLKRYDQLKKILITVPSVLILSIVGVLAGIFFGIMYVVWFIIVQSLNLAKFILRGCKPRREQQINQRNSNCLEFIQARQIENYQDQECYICLEGYVTADEKVYKCKNRHCYHKDCIIKWITSGNFSATRKCPICRVDLLN